MTARPVVRRSTSAALATLALLSPTASWAAGAFQVADINRAGSAFTAGAAFNSIQFNGAIYFAATDGSTGVELFRYDGTSTSLVADIYAGATASSPGPFVVYNNALYFPATTSANGRELWRMTAAGVVSRISDISTGSASSSPGNFVVFNNVLYFTATQTSYGNELWKYDGTTVSRVMDIYSGSSSSSPAYLTVYNGALYFAATVSGYGRELWKYTGAGNPIRVTDIATGSASSSPANLFVWNNLLYFQATNGAATGQFGTELYSFDGTTATRVADINPNTASSSPANFTVFNNTLYFTATHASYGLELWKYTGSGAPAVIDIYSGVTASNPANLTVVNNALFFSASHPSYGIELFKYDGTTLTPLDVYSGTTSSSPSFFVNYNNVLYFAANHPTYGRELWSTSGAAPALVADVYAGTTASSPVPFTVYNGALYFTANDLLSGVELRRWNGSTVTLVGDINRIGNSSPASGSTAPPYPLAVLNNVVYFAATDGINGAELWKYDGTSASMVMDIYAGATGSSPGYLTVWNGSLYFAATDAANGRELWRYTPGSGSPARISQIYAGASNANPAFLFVWNNALYFSATDGSTGVELWRYDGSTVARAADIYGGSASSSPSNFCVYNNLLYFAATVPTYGRELHVYNGSGVTRLSDIAAGSGSSSPANLVVYNGNLYFGATNGTTTGLQGNELWRYNGATVTRISDIYAGTGSSTPSDFAVYNGVLYFAATDSTTGREMWKYDGTTLSRVADIYAGTSSAFSSPIWLTPYADGLYFAAATAANGRELWKYTGLTAPTLVADIYAGSAASNPSYITPQGSGVTARLYFAANSLAGGVELWAYGNIDVLPPVVTPTSLPAANVAGWNNQASVTVTFAAADPANADGSAGSGVAKVSLSVNNGPFVDTTGASAQATITAEGTTIIGYKSTDVAGNVSVVQYYSVNIDRTNPTVAFLPASPAANAAGWNNTDVTISFTANDALSGVSTVNPAGLALVFNTDGAGQTKDVTVTDAAGNSVTLTSPVVNRDTVLPDVAFGAATPAANPAGWNNTDVTMGWTATDATSGVSGATSGSVTFNQDGTGVTRSVTVTDRAGNSRVANSTPVNRDTIAPTLTFAAAPSPAPNAAGWNNTNVLVSFTTADERSGVVAVSPTSPLLFNTDGASLTQTVQVTDKAGNVASFTSQTIKRDTVAPTVAFGDLSPLPNAAGWNNSTVTIPWTGADALSGFAAAAAGTLTFATEGASLTQNVTVTDLAGNSATVPSPLVKLDRTAPVVTMGSPSPAPNAAGWNRTNVEVAFTASDALSGIASSSEASPILFDTDTPLAGTSKTVTVTDVAGNSTTRTTATIKRDTALPTLTFGAPTPEPNESGWNTTDVTISWTGADALSGLTGAGTGQVTFTTDGTGQTRQVTLSDVAGNSATFTTVRIDRDATPPALTFAAPDPAPNAAGWNNTAVQIAFTASDATSGLADVDPDSPVLFSSDGAGQTRVITVVDRAGNSRTFTTVAVNVDTTAPTLTFAAADPAPNAQGWNNTDVTIGWTAADALSGLATDASGEVAITADGAGIVRSVTVRDAAGNQAVFSTNPVNRDTVAPALSFAAAAPAANANGWNNSTVEIPFTSSDALSGVLTVSKTSPLVFATDGAQQTQAVTVTDRAGNSTTETSVAVSRDTVAPVVFFLGATPEANETGWINQDVSVAFNASDSGSGIASTVPAASPLVLSDEGSGVFGQVVATDRAGNAATFVSAAYRIDKTAPRPDVASLPVVAGACLVRAASAPRATDNLSGVVVGTTADAIVYRREGSYTVTWRYDDHHGNASSQTQTFTVDDVTAPVPDVQTLPDITGNAGADGFTLPDRVEACGSELEHAADPTATDNCVGRVRGTTNVSRTFTSPGTYFIPWTYDDRNGNTFVQMQRVIVRPAGTGGTSGGGGSGSASCEVNFLAADIDLANPAGSRPSEPTEYQGALYFRAGDSGEGAELWRYDGVSASRAAAIAAGAEGSSPTGLTVFGDKLVFAATSGGSTSLWFFDGAQAHRVDSTAGTSPADLVVKGNALYFSAADSEGTRRLWAWDGVQDASIVLATGAEDPRDLAVFGGDLFFASGADLGVVHEGTFSVAAGGGGIEPRELTPTAGALYFTAVENGARRLWAFSSGSAAPVGVASTIGDPASLKAALGSLYFAGTDAAMGRELMALALGDGTLRLINVASDLGAITGSDPLPLAELDGALYFAADDGNTGRELWRAGANDAIGLAAEIFPGSRSSDPKEGAVFARQLFFQANDGISGEELWVYQSKDVTAPKVFFCPADRTPNDQGWYTSNLQVAFSATDDCSGVSGTVPALSPLAIATEGAGIRSSVEAVDQQSNDATYQTPPFSIDTTAPAITFGSPAPAPNAAGWNNSTVTIAFTAADNLSGVASTTPGASPLAFVADGAALTQRVTVTDVAGNSASADSPAVKLDTVAPGLVFAAASPAPNARGWNNSDVEVAFTTSDALSGVASTSAESPLVFNSDGAALSREVVVKDTADNAATFRTVTIKRDTAGPTLAFGDVTPAPNAAGWNNTDVTITWSGADGLSGLNGASAGTVSFTSDGSAQTRQVTLADNADNTRAFTSPAVNRDATAPTVAFVAPSPAANARGWHKGDVEIAFTTADNLSGVAAVGAESPIRFTADGAGLSRTFTVRDNADNTTTARTVTINRDSLAPTLTFGDVTPAPNANGWNNTDVTIGWTAADALSGLLGASTGVVRITSDGASITRQVTVGDQADNSATFTTVVVKRDTVLPTLTFEAPSASANANGWVSSTVTIAFTAADALSGVATTSKNSPLVFGTDGAGQSQQVVVTDRAGNSSSFTSLTINRDATPPMLAFGAVTPAPNAAGWNRTAVTVGWTASDATSGLAGASAGTVSFTTDGASLTRQVTAADRAGNTTTVTSPVVKLDTQNPAVTFGTPTPAPHASGWYNADVTYPFAVADSGSGVASMVPASGALTLTAEGAAISGNVTATDVAGNSLTVASPSIRIDKTRPVASVTTLPVISGECTARVTSAPQAVDNLAGTIIGTTQSPLIYNTLGSYTVVWAYDDTHGNVTTQNQTVTVTDTTLPVAPASLPDAIGEVSVTLTPPAATDNCDGTIVATTTDPVTYSAQGTFTVTWHFKDRGNNEVTRTQTVIVDDVTPPVPDVEELPNVYGGCAATVSTTPTATDNAAGTIAGTTADPLSYSGEGFYEITWSFDDGNGNVTTQTQQVIVQNIYPPDPAVDPLPDLSGECSVTVSVTPTATDSCVGVINGVTTDPLSYVDQGEYNITWLYDSGSGNSLTQNQHVSVADFRAPVPNVETLTTVTGQCSASVSATPTATDTCIGPVTGVTDDPLSYSAQGIYRIEWSYNDGRGNEAIQEQFVIVDDSIFPTLTCPSNITTNATSGSGANVTYPAATSSDNCGAPALTYSRGSPGVSTAFPLGTTTVNVTSTDVGGNVSTCSFTVTVGDTPPTITCPSAQTFEATSSAGRAVTFTPATATDLQSTPTIAYNKAQGSVFPLGTTSVQATATDSAGLTATCSFNVTVRDSTAPAITCPATQTVEATASTGAAVTWPQATATDAVSTPVITYNKTQGSVFAIGTTAVQATATDAASNSATCSFNVVVRDTTAPVVTCPANRTVEATSGSGATVTYPAATASDAVTAAPSIAYSKASNTVFALGTTTVNVTATDAASNAGTCSFTVTVQDTTAPAITCPANQTAEATSSAGATFSYPNATATDAVSTPVVSYDKASGTVFQLGTTTVVASARDTAGNTNTCSFTVTIRDTTAPSLTCPANRTAEATSSSGAVVTYPAATTADAVSTPVLAYDTASGATFALGTTTVRVTSTDAANNVASCTFTVTVSDTTAPSITCPANQTAEATSASGANVGYPAASATDAVSTPSITYDKASGAVFALGATTVNATARDAAGNTRSCAFTVTVSDTTAPAVTCPASRTVEATAATGATVTYTAPAATDAVTSSPVITVSKASGTVFPLGETAVNVSARDAAGNVGTCSFTITVSDTTAPAITCAADQIVEATSGAGATVTYPNATATDAVSTPVLTYDVAAGTVFALGSTPVQATATDAAGNHSSCSFNVVVRDTIAPALTCPADAIVEATSGDGAVATYAAATTSDPVSTPVLAYDKASGSTFALGATTVHVTSTDAASNVASCSFTITVRDTTAPAITCPSSIAAEATAANGATVGYPAAEATDAVSAAAITYDKASGTTFALGATVVRATAADVAGNRSSCTFTVTVRDTTAPALTCPADQSFEATSADGAPAAYAGATATDAVTSRPTIAYGIAAGTVLQLGTHTVEVSATDAAGNRSACSFDVTIRDTTAPAPDAASLPEVRAECSAARPAAPTATDIHDGRIVATTSAPETFGDQGEVDITWVFTDAQGNRSTQLQHVVVKDTIHPVPSLEALEDVIGAASARITTVPTASDNCSGLLRGTTSDPLFQNRQGEYIVTWTYTDAVGHTTTQTQKLIVQDSTPPTIEASRAPLANELGWNNTPVTVSFQCSDADSGVDFCPADIVLREGANQSASGTARDVAGLESTAGVTGVNVDLTNPAITIALASAAEANAAGWYNTPVTAVFTCDDALSGVLSCPEPVLLAMDGADQSVSGEAYDRAGNVMPASRGEIHIDQTAPTISGSRTPANEAGWNNTDVVVGFTCADALSGINRCSPAVTLSSDGADQSVTGVAVDVAGNGASTTVGAIHIDKTPPVVTLAAPPAYSRQTSIGVSGTAGDAGGSGVVSVTVSVNGAQQGGELVPDASGAVSAVVSLTREGENTIVLEAVDAAGNHSAALQTMIRDTTPPRLTITSPAPGAAFGVPTVSVTADLADATPTTVVIESASFDDADGRGTFATDVELAVEGDNTVHARATDAAGNVTETSVTVLLDLHAPVLTTDLGQPASFGPLAGDKLPFTVRVDAISGTHVTSTFGASHDTARGGAVLQFAAPLVEGPNTFSVVSTNEVGRASTLSWAVTYDKQAPTASLVVPPYARSSIDVRADAADDYTGVAAVYFAIDDGAETAAVVTPTGQSWLATLDTTVVADGSHQVWARLVDRMGNTRRVPTPLVIDNTRPTASITAPAADYLRQTVTLSGAATDATSGVARLTISVNGNALTSCAGAVTCSASLDTTTLPDGPFTVMVTAQDRSGNTHEVTRTYVADNSTPARFLRSPTQGQVLGASLFVSVQVVDVNFARVECTVDGVSLGVSTNPSFQTTVSTLSKLDGAVTVRCAATDLAGNVGVDQATAVIRNWSTLVNPRTLNLASKGGASSVTVYVEGGNVSVLAPLSSRNLALMVPGGSRVDTTVWAGFGTLGDEDGDRVPDYTLKFDRQALISAIRAGMAAGAIDTSRPVPIRLFAGAREIGSDLLTVIQ